MNDVNAFDVTHLRSWLPGQTICYLMGQEIADPTKANAVTWTGKG